MKRIERDRTTVLDVLGVLEKGESIFGVIDKPLKDGGKFIKITRTAANDGEGGAYNAWPRKSRGTPAPESLFLSTKFFTVEEWTLYGLGNPYCKIIKTAIRGFDDGDNSCRHGTVYERDYFELRVSALQGKLLYFPSAFYTEELRSWCKKYRTTNFAQNYYKIYPEFAKADCVERDRRSGSFRGGKIYGDADDHWGELRGSTSVAAGIDSIVSGWATCEADIDEMTSKTLGKWTKWGDTYRRDEDEDGAEEDFKGYGF